MSDVRRIEAAAENPDAPGSHAHEYNRFPSWIYFEAHMLLK
jgi:hypothetical protein